MTDPVKALDRLTEKIPLVFPTDKEGFIDYCTVKEALTRLAAIDRENAGTWWMDISTAPRDGTVILLLAKGDVPYVGAFDRGKWTDCPLKKAGLKYEGLYHVTHWQLLQPAPSTKNTERGI